ncbi:MAG: MarR family transcriptional regulator [Burkholderiales bacterium]|nr:MarR family transcriptional regulator [Burkholderiales bacterium]
MTRAGGSLPRGKAARTPVDVTRNLSYRIVQLSSTLARSASRDFGEYASLSMPVWRMLSVIGSRGPISLGEVAKVIGVDKGWLSRTLAQLEQRGLVRRSADPADARQFFLELTRAGRDLHLHGSAISVARQRHLEREFSADELVVLEGLLRRLQAAAEAMADDPGYLRA